MTCMPGSWGNVMSAAHWATALQTGLVTGLIALALSFTPLKRVFRNRFGNASIVGTLTALADAFSHPDHYGRGYAEPVVTLSLIHISEPTRLLSISYAVFCLK